MNPLDTQYGLYEDASKPFDEEGLDAIIFLQKMAGITESRDDAQIGWASMSEMDRGQTLRLYRLFKQQGMQQDTL